MRHIGLAIVLCAVAAGCGEKQTPTQNPGNAKHVPTSDDIDRPKMVEPAITAEDPPHATREGTIIRIQHGAFSFEIPKDWVSWHEKIGNNFHLTHRELDAVKLGEGEWDTEFAKVCNAIFPFETCVAHVGGEGWGKEAVAFSDLQVRVYVLDESVDAIEKWVDQRGTAEVTNLTTKPAIHERSMRGEWRRMLLEYSRFYGDYGGTAYIDCCYRESASQTIAFVFMYVGYQRQEAVISSILNSVVKI